MNSIAESLRATAPGVISVIGVTNGSYVESSAHLLTVIAPAQVRFRARGFQSDLGRLKSGLPARIVPPAGTEIADATPMTGKLALTPQAGQCVSATRCHERHHPEWRPFPSRWHLPRRGGLIRHAEAPYPEKRQTKGNCSRLTA